MDDSNVCEVAPLPARFPMAGRPDWLTGLRTLDHCAVPFLRGAYLVWFVFLVFGCSSTFVFLLCVLKIRFRVLFLILLRQRFLILLFMPRYQLRDAPGDAL